MIFLFALSLLTLVYVSIIYPLVIRFLSCNQKLEVPSESEEAFSIVLVVHNEEARLHQKLEELSGMICKGLEEILVIDDGSTDTTWAIMQSFDQAPFKMLHFERQGKSACLNKARDEVATAIAILMDCRQTVSEESVHRLRNYVARGTFDAMSGVLVKQGTSGYYWDMEKTLRYHEGLLGNTIGLSGCLAAIRKQRWIRLPEDCLVDDMALGLGVLSRGGRVGLDVNARAEDPLDENYPVEYERKLRTLSGNWQILMQSGRYELNLNRFQHWCLISHKWLRLGLPFYLFLLFVSAGDMAIENGLLLPFMGTLIFLAFACRVMFHRQWLEGLSLVHASLAACFNWRSFAEKGFWKASR